MGNGATPELLTSKYFSVMPKRDLANAMIVFMERAKGHPLNEEEILNLFNEERQRWNRKPVKVIG